MKTINPIKFKRTMMLNGMNSYKFNDAGEMCPISRFSLLAFADNQWCCFSEKTVLDEPICVMFNKKKADACGGISGAELVHYDKVILIWQEGIARELGECEEIAARQEPWNGLIFFNTSEGEKVFKWVDTGFCGEELSQVVMFLVSMVFGDQVLTQNEMLQRFRIGISAENNCGSNSK